MTTWCRQRSNSLGRTNCGVKGALYPPCRRGETDQDEDSDATQGEGISMKSETLKMERRKPIHHPSRNVCACVAAAMLLCLALAGCQPSLKTVGRTDNQKKLARIALEADDEAVRKAAVERLTNQVLLAGIAQMADNVGISERAVKKLKDQEILAQLAVGAENGYIRESAVSVMTNSTVLSKVAANDSIEWVRTSARKRLGELRSGSQATMEGNEP